MGKKEKRQRKWLSESVQGPVNQSLIVPGRLLSLESMQFMGHMGLPVAQHILVISIIIIEKHELQEVAVIHILFYFSNILHSRYNHITNKETEGQINQVTFQCYLLASTSKSIFSSES